MTLTVGFAGTGAVATAGADPSLAVWSYTVTGAGEDDFVVGERIALGLPAAVPIQDPTHFPEDHGLASHTVPTPAALRHFLEYTVVQPGPQIIKFIAPSTPGTAEMVIFTMAPGGQWQGAEFATDTNATPSSSQTVTAPTASSVPANPTPPAPRSSTGRPVTDFTGTLPYASEIFGVYQPLAGWLGQRNSRRLAGAVNDFPALHRELFTGAAARALDNPELAFLAGRLHPSSEGVLSPVGLVTLYREYFFEFDTFLGAPSGHIWISPGGTVEVVEVSTRKTLVEKTTEQSEDTIRKTEESLTNQDDVADAVKQDNANDTKLGASASAGANFAGIYHGDASATFSVNNTTKKSSEITHKHTRTQSNKVSSEIHRNFKTTFRTVTESTDTTSRRYVVQNTTLALVNYELRRKMRKVGVQVQHIGTRLSWQVFLDDPGRTLGLGDLVHVVPAPDLSALKQPVPPPPQVPMNSEFNGVFTLRRYGTTKNDPHQDANYTRSGPMGTSDPGMHSDNNDDHINANQSFNPVPPAPGYVLTNAIRLISAKVNGGDAQFLANFEKTGNDSFMVEASFLNFGGGRTIQLDISLTWQPPAVNPAQAEYQHEVDRYNLEVGRLQHEAYGNAVRERVNLVSAMRPRPPEDLRNEERQLVYGNLIRQLELFADPHLGSELIRQIFDVDEMLYFAAADYWRPSQVTTVPNQQSLGKYPVPKPSDVMPAKPPDSLAGQTVASWYDYTDADNSLDAQRRATPEWRVDYLITEASQPAPLGSSLGWLIQIDGDERRNEFLNASWVKAVLPIRPGHELDALAWLAQADVEGEAGLDQPYPFQPGDPAEYNGKTISEVLDLLAHQLQTANTDIGNTLASEKVFETGFDPLDGGFRPAEPYQIFDQWIEVLPTDQVVAVSVVYDPKTGQLM